MYYERASIHLLARCCEVVVGSWRCRWVGWSSGGGLMGLWWPGEGAGRVTSLSRRRHHTISQSKIMKKANCFTYLAGPCPAALFLFLLGGVGGHGGQDKAALALL